MALEDSVQISQPGDADYPLKTKDGSLNTIDAIRKRCNKDNLFEDPDFPPTDASIGNVGGDSARGEGGSKAGQLIWYRPAIACEKWKVGKPNFAIGQQAGGEGRVSALDMRQGGLGDCGWMTAMAAASSNPDLLNVIVPPDNYDGFDEDKYTGAFHFRVYDMQAGKYADIVVDDLLPYYKEDADSAFAKALCFGDDGKPCGSAEFWVPLAEKAFAKYRGAYGNMESWFKRPFCNLELITGGFDGDWLMRNYRGKPERYAELHELVKHSIDEGHTMLLCGNQEADSEEGYTKLGLISGHAYAVLGGAEVTEKDGGTRRLLLKARNPWGSTEWTGPLSDGDDEGWAKLDQDLRRRNEAGSAVMDEGVFWMDLRDVVKYYYAIERCIFGDGLSAVRFEWSAAVQEKKLGPPSQDRSRLNYMPAFKFEIKSGAKPTGPDGKCNPMLQFVIGDAKSPLDPLPTFGYYIFSLDPGQDLGNLINVLKGSAADRGGPYKTDFNRGVEGIYLDPGTYIIVPWLQADDESLIPKAYLGKALPFSVRMYTKPGAELRKIN